MIKGDYPEKKYLIRKKLFGAHPRTLMSFKVATGNDVERRRVMLLEVVRFLRSFFYA